MFHPFPFLVNGWYRRLQSFPTKEQCFLKEKKFTCNIVRVVKEKLNSATLFPSSSLFSARKLYYHHPYKLPMKSKHRQRGLQCNMIMSRFMAIFIGVGTSSALEVYEQVICEYGAEEWKGKPTTTILRHFQERILVVDRSRKAGTEIEEELKAELKPLLLTWQL